MNTGSRSSNRRSRRRSTPAAGNPNAAHGRRAAGETDPPRTEAAAASASEPDRGHPRLRSLLGGETREPVTDPTRPPWCWICRLEIRVAGNVAATGTGWLAGPSTVITAAHNIELRGIGRATEFRVPLTTPRGNAVFASDRFETLAGWSSTRHPDRDLGCLQLDEAVPGWAPWCDFGPLSDAALEGAEITVTGHGRSRGVAGLLTDTGPLGPVEPGRLYYAVGADEGQSGSPIWVDTGAVLPTVIGLHTNGVGVPSIAGLSPRTRQRMSIFNSATRLTDDRVDRINAWIATAVVTP